MKMFQHESHIMLVFVSLWIFLLMIGITGCGEDDDNELVGTWTLETVDGQSLEQFIAEESEYFAATSELTFYNDGLMVVEATIEVEAKGDGLDFSGRFSTRSTATYSLSGSNFTVTLVKIEVIEETGDFKDIGVEELYEESVDLLDESTATGSWSRKGNTLTLIDDLDGVVRVYKKK